ncbi:MAG: ABC transporter substrate-binding protein [Acidimicrobiales bacterium]|jgi:iron complex transport system substrate-binding protein
MRPTVIKTAALLLLVAFLGACGTTAAAPKATKPSGGAFPVSVTSAAGTVRIAQRPTRILCLSPSATQMLYAIGAGHQVVGVDKYSWYPADAPRTDFTGYESSAEDYLSKRPDLVILSTDTTDLVAQLKTLHVPTLLLPAVTTIAGVDRQIDELGAATGHVAEAGRTVSAIAADLDKVAHPVGSRARGRTYYIEFDPTLYSATSKTFIGALFSRFGMVDIADPAGRHGSSYPQLSAEYLIKTNPDYVFLADTVCCGQSAMTFAKRPGFSTLRAVRLGHVFTVNDSVASEWGPHSLETFFSVIVNALTGKQS